MKHRKEEDDLYRKFARAREEEDKRMKVEFRVNITNFFFILFYNVKKYFLNIFYTFFNQNF